MHQHAFFMIEITDVQNRYQRKLLLVQLGDVQNSGNLWFSMAVFLVGLQNVDTAEGSSNNVGAKTDGNMKLAAAIALLLSKLPWFVSWVVLCKIGKSHHWGKHVRYGRTPAFQICSQCGISRTINVII